MNLKEEITNIISSKTGDDKIYFRTKELLLKYKRENLDGKFYYNLKFNNEIKTFAQLVDSMSVKGLSKSALREHLKYCSTRGYLKKNERLGVIKEIMRVLDMKMHDVISVAKKV